MYVENPSEWGAKHICQACNGKYYDLRRTPIICPKCQAEFVEPPKHKSAAASAKGIAWRQRARAAAAESANGSRLPRSGVHSPFADRPSSADREEGTVKETYEE